MTALPVDHAAGGRANPRDGRVAAEKMQHGALACDIAALISERDILLGEARRSCDLTERLEVLRVFRQQGRKGAETRGADANGCAHVDQATRQWRGRTLVDDLASHGILIRSPSLRGVAEEAPGAYKDVSAVVEAADRAGLARKVAKLKPLVCIKG